MASTGLSTVKETGEDEDEDEGSHGGSNAGSHDDAADEEEEEDENRHQQLSINTAHDPSTPLAVALSAQTAAVLEDGGSGSVTSYTDYTPGAQSLASMSEAFSSLVAGEAGMSMNAGGSIDSIRALSQGSSASSHTSSSRALPMAATMRPRSDLARWCQSHPR